MNEGHSEVGFQGLSATSEQSFQHTLNGGRVGVNQDGMPVSYDYLLHQHRQSVDTTLGGIHHPETGTANFVQGGDGQWQSVEQDPAGWLRAHGMVAISDRTGEEVTPSVAQARMLVQARINNMAMEQDYAGGMSVSANDNALPPHLARVRGRFI